MKTCLNCHYEITIALSQSTHTPDGILNVRVYWICPQCGIENSYTELVGYSPKYPNPFPHLKSKATYRFALRNDIVYPA